MSVTGSGRNELSRRVTSDRAGARTPLMISAFVTTLTAKDASIAARSSVRSSLAPSSAWSMSRRTKLGRRGALGSGASGESRPLRVGEIDIGPVHTPHRASLRGDGPVSLSRSCGD